MKLTDRLKKFLIVGSSAATVNFLSMILFVEVFGFKTYFLKNVANILAIEISILFNFIFQRHWTWGDVEKRQGLGLMTQLLSFHMAALTGIFLRIILFALLEKWGVFYLLNVAIGIGIAAGINYFLYDKLIFRGVRNEKRPV